MKPMLTTLLPYIPPTLLDYALALDSAESLNQAAMRCFPAAVLFVDVSGFTPLTEMLARQGSQGAEELTSLLNGYFGTMISLIEAQGGEVAKFSGDALTVLFPLAAGETLGQATRRAYQAAEAMQQAIQTFQGLQTSVGTTTLGLKIGIGAGEVLALHVGGLRGRWDFVVAGDPLAQVAAAESAAERGEIRLSAEASAQIVPESMSPRQLVTPDIARLSDPAAVEHILRGYVAGAILNWIDAGLRDWLAVLRPMSVIFMGVGGLDYTAPQALERLHTLVRSAQELVYSYEGSLNKVVVDDKGTVLLMLFGAPPLAHEDDAARAVRCALAIQQQISTGTLHTLGLRVALGIASGSVFTGPVGSATRREYTAMGDTVNRAARLMGKAGQGNILCDFATYHQSQQRVAFEHLPPTRLKGIAGLMRVYAPLNTQPVPGDSSAPRPYSFSAQGTSSSVAQHAFVGRQQEIAYLERVLAALQAGHGHIVIIEGEAGIGKSRLIGQLVHMVRERGLTGLLGAGQSVEQQTPYRAWRDIFTSYFELDTTTDIREARQRIWDVVKEVAPEHLDRVPLLNDILSLSIPDTDLTASLEPTLRQQNLFLLLISLLRAWIDKHPLIIVLEDAHWLDSLSWDLMVKLARIFQGSTLPLLLIPVTRPVSPQTLAGQRLAVLRAQETAAVLALKEMEPYETVELVTARLGLPAGGLPQPVAELVQRQAEGNPFYAEELVFTLRDQQVIAVHEDPQQPAQRVCVVQGDLSQATRMLPTTIQGLILARMDRLSPELQLVLRVGAVIGRSFSYVTLRHTLQEHIQINENDLKRYLHDLTLLDLTPLDVPEPEPIYFFKHIITQEVAYQTLLFAQRRELHCTVATWYEQTYRGRSSNGDTPVAEQTLATYYPLLVHHYRQAEQREKERYYAHLAGKHAAARFANAEAVTYLSRALELTEQTDMYRRHDLLLTRERVYNLQGARDLQQTDLATLHTLADDIDSDRLRIDVLLRRANYAEMVGDYPDAIAATQQAVQLAEQIGSQYYTASGYLQWGCALWRQGSYRTAQKLLDEARKIARGAHIHTIEADILRNRGTIAWSQGDLDAADAYYNQSLALCRKIGDRLGESKAQGNLGNVAADRGDFIAARSYHEQDLYLCRELGDRLGESAALLNRGIAARSLGDYAAARHDFEQSLVLCRELDHRQGEGLALSNLGLLLHLMGDDAAALAYSERGLHVAQEIGDRYTQSYLLTHMGHALVAQDRLDEAADAYQQANDLRSEMGLFILQLDALAGLAELELQKGNMSIAKEYINKIDAFSHMASNTMLEGSEDPIRIYWTWYRVLRAEGDDSAMSKLRNAHAVLLTRAQSITEPALQHAFLHDIPAHQRVIHALKSYENQITHDSTSD